MFRAVSTQVSFLKSPQEITIFIILHSNSAQSSLPQCIYTVILLFPCSLLNMLLCLNSSALFISAVLLICPIYLELPTGLLPHPFWVHLEVALVTEKGINPLYVFNNIFVLISPHIQCEVATHLFTKP